MTCLNETLTSLGQVCSSKGSWVELPSGLTLFPQVVAVEPLDGDRGVKTTSTVQTSHNTLVPTGVFEYQHATGRNVRESFSAGFKDWAQSDLPVFVDALSPQPATCMFLTFNPRDEARRNRRVVLGPPTQMVQAPDAGNQDHPFCPCCLFTNCHSAFTDLIESDRFRGIRLFAMRNADGLIEADCRVDGEDWSAGKEALIQYGQRWPNRGFEFRKQYVVIQPMP